MDIDLNLTVESRMKRYAADFELWARECVKIIDKESGREIPFVLNEPQRRVLDIMERERRSGRPVRIIMLKARQWGGSTLIQIYLAWMQLVVHRGWNSLTCAHVKDASAAIRGMYTRLLRSYPEELKEGQPKDWTLSPYEKSASVSYIAARDCQVGIATSMAPNSVRGSNFALAHLSEVAFWGDGDPQMAEEIVRTVSGSVLRCPDSVVVMESTANGTDNYFYREWERAVAGESDKIPIFVPWYEIELYRRGVSREETGRVLASFDEYERNLLASGVPMEGVAWYHDKRREYQSHEAMMAEFPTTPEEAFTTAKGAVFDPAYIPEGRESELRPDFGVYIPGGEHDTLSLFALRSHEFAALEDITLTEGEGRGLDRCLSLVGSLPLMIVEAGRREISHAIWCARRAAGKGVRLISNGDDTGWWRPEGEILSEWVDTLAGMMRERRVIESSDMTNHYANFRYEAPERSPEILARMAAGIYLTQIGGASDFSSLW